MKKSLHQVLQERIQACEASGRPEDQAHAEFLRSQQWLFGLDADRTPEKWAPAVAVDHNNPCRYGKGHPLPCSVEGSLVPDLCFTHFNWHLEGHAEDAKAVSFRICLDGGR
jgi:hypothetical protein